jgi:NCAIR mutase (PurE)-related protein
MNAETLKKLFDQVRRGKLSPDEAVDRLRHLPFEDLGFAKLDHHRALRQGMPEVIFAPGKTPAQVAGIFRRLAAHNGNVLATRATEDQYAAVAAALVGPVPQPEYRPLARAIVLKRDRKKHGKGVIVVVSAGTSDIPVAEEAVVTAELMGNHVQHIYDVGVAGIHRLLSHREALAKASVIVVCAGMEGALPSVVGGLVGVPAALLGMMNSCASNVSVVNIDNGFGAGYVASLINRR